MARIISAILEKSKDIIIVSGGQPKGADGIAKNLALKRFHLEYREFAPRHYDWNEYCVPPKEEYSKPYHVGLFFQRNTEIAEYCDCLLAFFHLGLPSNGTNDTLQKFKSKHDPKRAISISG